MRRVILIFLLIGAAFLGGAFVNGPGLQWAQARVLRSLGLKNGGEIAAVDLDSTLKRERGPEPAEPLKPYSAGPPGLVAPIPSTLSKSGFRKEDTSDRLPASEPRPKSAKSRSDSVQVGPSSSTSAALPRSVTNSSSSGTTPLDGRVTPVEGDSIVAVRQTALPDINLGPPALLDSLAPLLPRGNPRIDAPPSASKRAFSRSKPTEGVNDEWSLLKSRMQTFGVSRFTIEGDLDGSVVFTCLIPVVGRQAVSEQFEGEGDDVIHAAQAALRRIILWRASQVARED